MPLPRNRRTTDNHIMAIYIQYNTKSNAMNTGKLLFVPSGGLANRMRAMASAWQLAANTGVKIETIWFCDWALNAPFHSIFEPIDNAEMVAREAKAWELLTLDRPRKRNFRIPLLKSSRLFPLSYLFQKNQYKCDIVPSLPAGLCGIEPVEHAPV